MPENISKALVWEESTEKRYETGVDQGVFYPLAATGNHRYGKGVVWNGLTAVNEKPSGAEATPLYAANRKWLNLFSEEDFGCTIEAFMYPDEFAECNGEKQLISGVTGVNATQQRRKMFGFSYRTLIGNEASGVDYGYKIHVVYGCTASPSEKNNNTTNENPEAMTMSFEVTTVPEAMPLGFKPTAHLVFDSTKLSSEAMTVVKNALYGGAEDPYLPTPTEFIELLGEIAQAAG